MLGPGLNIYFITHFCRIRDRGGALPPPPPIIFEGQNLPQQTVYHWKGNLSKSLIHFRYRQNILISRLYEQLLRNAPQRHQKKDLKCEHIIRLLLLLLLLDYYYYYYYYYILLNYYYYYYYYYYILLDDYYYYYYY